MRLGQYEVVCPKCQDLFHDPLESQAATLPAVSQEQLSEITNRLHSNHTHSSSGSQTTCRGRHGSGDGRSISRLASQSSSKSDLSLETTTRPHSNHRRPKTGSSKKASKISERLHSAHTRSSRAKVYIEPPPQGPAYPEEAAILLELQRQRIKKNNGDPSLVREYDLFSRPAWSASLV